VNVNPRRVVAAAREASVAGQTGGPGAAWRHALEVAMATRRLISRALRAGSDSFKQSGWW